MADSQAIIVGAGGIAALPPFTATDETLGRGVFITSDDPPGVGAANFGSISGEIWIQSGGVAAANAQRAVTIGRSLQNIALITGNAQNAVVIGHQAGIVAASPVSSCVAIGEGALATGLSVAIGQNTVVRALAGTSRNVGINATGLSHAAPVGLVAINTDASSVASASGVFINCANSVNTGGGVGITSGAGNLQAFGILIATGAPVLTGDRNIAIGDSVQAGAPTTATDYRRCIAIGTNAVATGSGVGGNVGAIAIGDQASATGTTAAASMALGVSAVAVAGEAAYGSTTRPFVHRLFSSIAGEGLRVDASAAADDVRILVWDVTAAALVRVSRGAVDSGGVGFRLLRIPN